MACEERKYIEHFIYLLFLISLRVCRNIELSEEIRSGIPQSHYIGKDKSPSWWTGEEQHLTACSHRQNTSAQ